MSSEHPGEVSEQEITHFLEKLRAFNDGLNPTEQTVFAGVMRLWAEIGGDVSGFGFDPKSPPWDPTLINPAAIQSMLTGGGLSGISPVYLVVKGVEG